MSKRRTADEVTRLLKDADADRDVAQPGFGLSGHSKLFLTYGPCNGDLGACHAPSAPHPPTFSTTSSTVATPRTTATCSPSSAASSGIHCARSGPHRSRLAMVEPAAGRLSIAPRLLRPRPPTTPSYRPRNSASSAAHPSALPSGRSKLPVRSGWNPPSAPEESRSLHRNQGQEWDMISIFLVTARNFLANHLFIMNKYSQIG